MSRFPEHCVLPEADRPLRIALSHRVASPPRLFHSTSFPGPFSALPSRRVFFEVIFRASSVWEKRPLSGHERRLGTFLVPLFPFRTTHLSFFLTKDLFFLHWAFSEVWRTVPNLSKLRNLNSFRVRLLATPCRVSSFRRFASSPPHPFFLFERRKPFCPPHCFLSGAASLAVPRPIFFLALSDVAYCPSLFFFPTE